LIKIFARHGFLNTNDIPYFLEKNQDISQKELTANMVISPFKEGITSQSHYFDMFDILSANVYSKTKHPSLKEIKNTHQTILKKYKEIEVFLAKIPHSEHTLKIQNAIKNLESNPLILEK
jgi:hypothetical protein